MILMGMCPRSFRVNEKYYYEMPKTEQLQFWEAHFEDDVDIRSNVCGFFTNYIAIEVNWQPQHMRLHMLNSFTNASRTA